MAKLLVILLIALVFEAVGVVLLSLGLKQVGEVREVTITEVARLLKRGATNPNVLWGIFFEAIFFAGLLILMTKGDVSFVWPLTSLGFGLTTLAAKLFLHEQVSAARWTGVLLIMLGAMLITHSEHKAKSGKAAIVQETQERQN